MLQHPAGSTVSGGYIRFIHSRRDTTRGETTVLTSPSPNEKKKSNVGLTGADMRYYVNEYICLFHNTNNYKCGNLADVVRYNYKDIL